MYAVPRWREAGLDPRKGASLSGGEWRREARPEWEDARDLEGDILLWTDPRYPALLRELPDAPALLYTRGDPGLLLRPCMAVVGSRGCTRSGREQSAAVARELSACGIAVVSGMARGIDRAAHEAALRENGSSIAVLGSGVDVIYPRQCADLYHELCDGGLILSEFPPGSLPQGPHFPIRNRIISGLSLGVVVGEAALKSGSMVTARIALEQNRSVFALLPDEARSTPSGMPAERRLRISDRTGSQSRTRSRRNPAGSSAPAPGTAAPRAFRVPGACPDGSGGPIFRFTRAARRGPSPAPTIPYPAYPHGRKFQHRMTLPPHRPKE